MKTPGSPFYWVTTLNLHLSITDCLKATPVEEGGRRLIYIEASNEVTDQQNEIVLAKALKDSAAYYLRYGNLDLDHITQVGAKSGVKDYHFYEVGRPVDVRISDKHTFVKGEVFQGEGESADRANKFWASLTAQQPAQRWYPSIGGAVLDREEEQGPGGKRTLIKAVRWTNIGFSKTPVNQAVGEVSAMPIGAFAKCMSAAGFDLAKALEAGYGTDSASLEGGGALRRQSLDGGVFRYPHFQDRISRDLIGKRIPDASSKGLSDHATKHYGISESLAKDYAHRFVAQLSTDLKRNHQ